MVDNGHFHYWELIFLVATLGQHVDQENNTCINHPSKWSQNLPFWLMWNLSSCARRRTFQGNVRKEVTLEGKMEMSKQGFLVWHWGGHSPWSSGVVYTLLGLFDLPQQFYRCPPAGWSLLGLGRCFPRGQQCHHWAQTNEEKKGMWGGFLVHGWSSGILNLGSTEPHRSDWVGGLWTSWSWK